MPVWYLGGQNESPATNQNLPHYFQSTTLRPPCPLFVVWWSWGVGWCHGCGIWEGKISLNQPPHQVQTARSSFLLLVSCHIHACMPFIVIKALRCVVGIGLGPCLWYLWAKVSLELINLPLPSIDRTLRVLLLVSCFPYAMLT